jgi:acyl-CoA synthetase (NDP forming)
VADKCESLGLSVPEPAGATRQRLEEYLPDFGSARNPIDLTAQAAVDPGMLARCLRALAADDDINPLVVFSKGARAVDALIRGCGLRAPGPASVPAVGRG